MAETNAPSTALEPFFLPSLDRRIFACYHPPTEPARDCGVVICYPIWQEYIRSHRACLNLAKSLARAGFPSLRFDYSGTGDSSGDGSDATLERWKEDLRRAGDELRQRSGVSTISLVGLRLGASLAAACASEDGGGHSSLVLWDPVVNGKAYLDEALALHENALHFFFAQPKSRAAEPQLTELLGFPLNPTLREELAAIDLLASKGRPAGDVLIVESHTGEPAQQLAEHLRARSARVEFRHVPGFRVWTEHTDKGLVPSNVVAAIVNWLSEIHA